MFEAGDAFRLLGRRRRGGRRGEGRLHHAAATRPATADRSRLEFSGPVPDAQPVREFLEPQLRDAAARAVEAGFTLTFTEGLPLEGDAAEKLTARLCRFASGAAHVSASAEARP